MREYKRANPLFSLCGLNCGLCPRHHADGPSRCPGCGGPDFHLKHPACAVITCSRKHGDVEFCYQCSEYPCGKYREPSRVDSFISYRNVIRNFEKAAAEGLDAYLAELNEKIELLEFLLKTCDEGRSKGFYCLAVDLLSLGDLREIRRRIAAAADLGGADLKSRAARVRELFQEYSRKRGIELKLRK